jgi:hypothetical protein
MKRCAVMLLSLLCCSANAASPKPAAAPATPAETPAVDTMQQAGEAGTTIVGERDSDVGLYLTPWKEEHPDNIDPPPSLLDEPPQPVDARGFARQVRDASTITAYRREQRLPNR